MTLIIVSLSPHEYKKLVFVHKYSFLITKLTILSVEATLVYVKSSTENLDLNRPTYMYIVSVSYNYPSSSSPCNNPKCISMSDNSTT